MMDIIHFLNVNNGVIQSISTIALVAITVYYAIQTRKTVEEMSLQRKNSTLPVISAVGFDIHTVSKKQEDYCIGYALRNIGNGPALHIMVSFYDKETKKKVAESEHLIDFIEKGELERGSIHVPKEEIDSLRYREEDGELISRLICRMTFHSFVGDSYETMQGIVFRKKSKIFRPILGAFNFYPRREKPLIKKLLKKIKVLS